MSARAIILFIFCSFTALNSSVFRGASSPTPQATASINYAEAIGSLNMSNIQKHVQYLSSLETRAVGYKGNELAMRYIKDKFENYAQLANISLESFQVVTWVDHGANITAASETIEVYPISPNLLSPSTTPPQGITGRLIYVGDGNLKDFDGKEVERNIIVMDWFARENWLLAANLGAKAVIFIPPNLDVLFSSPYEMGGGGEYTQGWGWSVDAPFLFPRFYSPEPAKLIYHINETVTLKAHTVWERATSWNVIGYVEGKDPSIVVLLTAYYDTGGVAISYAPGAREAIGVSTLIELARYFNEHQPKHTIMFVALSGHWNGLAGAMQLGKDYLTKIGRAEKIWHWLHLDLSTESEVLWASARNMYPRMGETGLYPSGWGEWPGYGAIPVYFKDIMNDMNQKKVGGETYEGIFVDSTANHIWSKYFSASFGFATFLYDSGIAFSISPCATGGLANPPSRGHLVGIAVSTAYDVRPYYGYPFDTFDTIGAADISRLRKQLTLLYSCLISMLSLDDYYERFITPYKASSTINPIDYPNHNWGTVLTGQVVEWNVTKAWYDPVPGAIVRMANQGGPAMYSVSDKEGFFNFSGAIQTGAVFTLAIYKINSTTGEIIYAPDMGTHTYSPLRRDGGGRADYPPVRNIGLFAVFKASTVVFLEDLTSNSMRASGAGYSVVKAEDYTPPTSWASLEKSAGTYIKYYGRTTLGDPNPSSPVNPARHYSVTVIAVPPGTPIIFLRMGAIARYPNLIALNSSDIHPLGSGYVLKSQQQLVFTHGSLRYVQDLYRINEDNYQKLLRISSVETESEEYKMHRRAGTLIQMAQESLQKHEYSKFLNYTHISWSLSLAVYEGVRAKIEDAASAVPFFAVLLIPFTYLFERLVLQSSGTRRIISLIAIFAAILMAFASLHPGYLFAANPAMMVIGVSVVLLVLPIYAIMTARVSGYFEAIRARLLGKHTYVVSRGSEIINAFSIGVGNMRRRKVRTLMLMIAIVSMITGLVTFSSITVLRKPVISEIPGKPLYDGIYMHETPPSPYRDLGKPLLEYLYATLGDQAIISPRAWRYANFLEEIDLRDVGYFSVSYDNKKALIRNMLGLTVQEPGVSKIDSFLLAGRWFIPTDRMVTILDKTRAAELGITEDKLPAKISVFSMNFTVIGIIESGYDSVLELDGMPITPVRMDVIPPNEYDQHAYAEDTIIVRFEDLLIMGGNIGTVSIKFHNANNVIPAASALEEKFGGVGGIDMWFSANQKIYQFSVGLQVTLLGAESQVVPIAIVCLSLVNMLFGSVYERRGEIATYSTVGLSPFDISFMFLAETMVFGIVGSVTGFVSGLLSIKVITTIFPVTLFLDFSSKWVWVVVLITMGVIFGSSLYPVLMVAKLVTPSLKRKWELTTKPIGDVWEIPLPFYVGREEEAKEFVAFMHEYVDAHLGEAVAIDFSVKELRVVEGEEGGVPYMGLTAEARIPPYDLNVAQRADIRLKFHQKRWELALILKRTSGPDDVWVRLNRNFIDLMRKQMLLWRTVAPDDRIKYAERFLKIKTEKHLN